MYRRKSKRISYRITSWHDKVHKKGPARKSLTGPVNNNHIIKKTKSIYIIIQIGIILPYNGLVILIKCEGEF